MFSRILVAYDGTAAARHALDVAIEVAVRFQSSLTIGFVRAPGSTPSDTVLDSLVPLEESSKSFGAVTEEVRGEALARGVPSVDSHVLEGEVVDALLSWARHQRADLLVVGSRGLSRGKRLFLGSVSSSLVQQSHCPVLVVRGTREHLGRSERRTSTAHPGGAARGSG